MTTFGSDRFQPAPVTGQKLPAQNRNGPERPAHDVASRQPGGAGRARSAIRLVDPRPGQMISSVPRVHGIALRHSLINIAQPFAVRIHRSWARSGVHPEGDPARRKPPSDGCSDQRPPLDGKQSRIRLLVAASMGAFRGIAPPLPETGSAGSGTLNIHCIIAPSRGPLDRQGICARTPRSTHG